MDDPFFFFFFEWNGWSVPCTAELCWCKWTSPCSSHSALPAWLWRGDGILPELTTVNGSHAWCKKYLIRQHRWDWLYPCHRAGLSLWILSASVYSRTKSSGIYFYKWPCVFEAVHHLQKWILPLTAASSFLFLLRNVSETVPNNCSSLVWWYAIKRPNF